MKFAECGNCGGSGRGPGVHYNEHMLLEFESCQACDGKGHIIIHNNEHNYAASSTSVIDSTLSVLMRFPQNNPED